LSLLNYMEANRVYKKYKTKEAGSVFVYQYTRTTQYTTAEQTPLLHYNGDALSLPVDNYFRTKHECDK